MTHTQKSKLTPRDRKTCLTLPRQEDLTPKSNSDVLTTELVRSPLNKQAKRLTNFPGHVLHSQVGRSVPADFVGHVLAVWTWGKERVNN